jgi:hypothetical protein
VALEVRKKLHVVRQRLSGRLALLVGPAAAASAALVAAAAVATCA